MMVIIVIILLMIIMMIILIIFILISFKIDYISFSDEICAVLKLDSIHTNQTNWKPVAKDAWEQEFRIELERVSDL